MTKKQKFEGEFEKIFKVLNRDMYNKKRKLYEYVKLGLTLRLLKKKHYCIWNKPSKGGTFVRCKKLTETKTYQHAKRDIKYYIKDINKKHNFDFVLKTKLL